MANKVKGSYVVVPAEQVDSEIDGKGIGAIAFPKASLAMQFVEDVQAFAKKRAAQLLGLGVNKDDLETMSEDEQKEAKKTSKAKIENLPQVVPFDVLIQKLDESGNPDGDPIEYETARD